MNEREEVLVAEEMKKHEYQGPKHPSENRQSERGNQQKVVLSKWIFAGPDILILDEPTRGIDVGAKFEIYTIIHRLAAEGKGVLVISSELPEVLGLCDRIYVMNAGRITGEVSREEATQETLMRYMTKSGGEKHGNAN